MTARWAFFPNLDADHELGVEGPYQPRKETLAAIASQTPALASLVHGHPVLDRAAPAPFEPAQGELAVCWCPTRHAQSVLQRAGWPLPKAPPHDVLRRVNSRRFIAEHGPNRIGRRWVDAGSERSFIATGRFRLKRAFGFAGRGQRVVGTQLSPDDRRWIEDSLAGGFSCEPEFELALELSLHGYVDRAGLLLGDPCRFVCDRFGSPVHFEPLERTPYETELRHTATVVATALSDAGYFGPFGIDAFVANTAEGELLNPLSDLNARFTLAWSVGMGALRDVAFARLCEPP